MKARIDHPEDLIAEEGAIGAQRALDALVEVAKNPKKVSLKFDGSPSLIFGWDDKGFVLTDKSGYGAKRYDGFARSPQEVKDMLNGVTGRRINAVTQEDIQKRNIFATKIANCYNALKSLVPKSFKGYLQGDLLWTKTPAIIDGNYVFGPLKIKYKVPINSDLGKRIKNSKIGIVIHSYLSGQDEYESRSIDGLKSLRLNNIPEIVIVPHELHISQKLNLTQTIIDKIQKMIDNSNQSVTELLNGDIKSLSHLLKSFLAYKASTGNGNYTNSPSEFIQWINSDDSKTSDQMKSNILDCLKKHKNGYNNFWILVQTITRLKLFLKNQLDKIAETSIHAELSDVVHPDLIGKHGHEGFVADTIFGKIKLVNRHDFMRKTPIAENASGGSTSSGSIASIANPVGNVISRTPNLFGYVPYAVPKKKRKKKQ